MMLAISAERFRAVCYPLSKRHVSKSDTEDKFFGLLDIFPFQFATQNMKYCNFFSVTMQIRFASIDYFSAVKISEILPIQANYSLWNYPVLDNVYNGRPRFNQI